MKFNIENYKNDWKKENYFEWLPFGKHSNNDILDIDSLIDFGDKLEIKVSNLGKKQEIYFFQFSGIISYRVTDIDRYVLNNKDFPTENFTFILTGSSYLKWYKVVSGDIDELMGHKLKHFVIKTSGPIFEILSIKDPKTRLLKK